MIKHVSGLDFERAILRLALLGHPTDYESLKKNELENADHTIWDKICGAKEEAGETAFDSVRALFPEGRELYPEAGFQEKTHVQLAVRKESSIIAYFRPRLERL